MGCNTLVLTVIGKTPVLLLNDCYNVTVTKTVCTEPLETFLILEGEKTANIILSENNLTGVEKELEFRKGASAETVIRK